MAAKLPDPAELQKLFESWWRTGSTVVVTIAGAITALQISASIAYGIAIAITITGFAIAIIVYRREARHQQGKETAEQGLKSLPLTGSAFRGLQRFMRGEVLPGPQRRRDAMQLLRHVLRSDSKIALVTGDSGAGKSSLLECALVDGLEKAGHPVVMVSNSSQLIPSNLVANSELLEIKRMIAGLVKQIGDRREQDSKVVVLILDQFEELLSRFRSRRDRDELGDGLWSIIASGARVVIGIRKEYLVDFKGIATRFSYDVS